uniref:Uncharacterized protein LOC111114800 n=1 Tax=Crassostrea virginica TaxID=6565 RepID=A0A8B8C016_CRAVI|nr:uncharacterized protein LOC111114800 [Crassostrea virginica]
MTPHFILVVLTACFMENYASLYENDDQLKTMMARIEMLELKSEKYDRLIEENELLREKIKENDGRISELNTKVKNLEKRNEYITVESERFQTEIDKTLTQKDDKFNLVTAVKNTLQMNITESKPKDDLVIAKMLERYVQRRIVPVNSPSHQIAFYAYVSDHDQSSLPTHHTLVFDTVKLNRGQGYNENDGIFTVPVTGVYGFAWTVAVHDYSWASVEILVNGEVVGSAYAHAPTGMDFGTGFAIVQANAGDHAFIRMQENGNGAISSNVRGRTSFLGWFMF